MGSTCWSLTKGFPSWFKLKIQGPYVHLGKHLLGAWFLCTNDVLWLSALFHKCYPT